MTSKKYTRAIVLAVFDLVGVVQANGDRIIRPKKRIIEFTEHLESYKEEDEDNDRNRSREYYIVGLGTFIFTIISGNFGIGFYLISVIVVLNLLVVVLASNYFYNFIRDNYSSLVREFNAHSYSFIVHSAISENRLFKDNFEIPPIDSMLVLERKQNPEVLPKKITFVAVHYWDKRLGQIYLEEKTFWEWTDSPEDYIILVSNIPLNAKIEAEIRKHNQLIYVLAETQEEAYSRLEEAFLQNQKEMSEIENSEFVEFPKEIANLTFIATGAPGNEKILFSGILKDYHVTLHFGTKSKIVDIHLTREKDRKHLTLFRISHYTIARSVAMIKPLILFGGHKYIYNKQNRINIGKLIRHKCILQKLNGDEVEFLAGNVKRKKDSVKLKLFRNVRQSDYANMFIEPCDVHESTCDLFQVYSYRKNSLKTKGYLFKSPYPNKSHELYFVSKRNWKLNTALLEWGILMAITSANLECKEAILRKFQSSIRLKYKGSNVFKQLAKDMNL